MNIDNVVYAFFDVDGTILNINSMLNFLEYFFERYYGDKSVYSNKLESQENDERRHLLNIGQERNHEHVVSNRLSIQMMNEYQSKISENISREKLNELYYQNFTGIMTSTLTSYGSDWFDTIICNDGLFNKECLARLKWHQQMNHQIILVSGGFFATLNPLAKYLNLQNILCIKPRSINGRLNGEIDLQTQTIGVGKQNAIQSFLQLQNINIDQALSRSYAYGDHISDFAMLSMVGNPVVVGNNTEMLNIANNNKWHTI